MNNITSFTTGLRSYFAEHQEAMNSEIGEELSLLDQSSYATTEDEMLALSDVAERVQQKRGNEELGEVVARLFQQSLDRLTVPTQESQTDINSLPDKPLRIVISFLNPTSQCQAALISRCWHAVTNEQRYREADSFYSI